MLYCIALYYSTILYYIPLHSTTLDYTTLLDWIKLDRSGQIILTSRRDFTGIMLSTGSYPNIAFFQVSEIVQFTQMNDIQI